MSDKRLQMPVHLLQVTNKFTFVGQQCRNVMYLFLRDNGGDPADWTNVDAVEAVGDLADAYSTNFMPFTAHDCSFDSASYVFNAGVPTGPLLGGDVGGGGFPFHGGQAHDGAPTAMTLAVKLQTNLLGRSNHGRFYFIGLNAGLYDVDNPNFLKPSSTSDFQAACTAFGNACLNIGLSSTNTWSLCVASFVHNGSVRSPAVAQEIIQVGLTDNIFDTQRRRGMGRGI